MADFKTMFGNRIYILAAVVLFGSGGLFAYLESVGLEVWCEDKVAEVGVIENISCTIYNPKYRSIYLYNAEDWKVTFSPDIVDSETYIKYYGKFRFTNFTMATRLGNIPDDRKYVFVFPSKSTKEFQVRVNVSKPIKIKWDFGTLDPIIMGYNYVYKNETIDVPINEIITKRENCNPSDDQCKSCDVYKNKTSCWYLEVNITKQIGSIQKIVPNEEIRIGVESNNKIYNAQGLNVAGDTLALWDFPIGGRDLENVSGLGFNKCRDYEKKLGKCKEVNLLNAKI